MSAFVGIVNMAGESVDVAYLEAMARYLKKIGPDNQSIWSESGVGMVHALLKTTVEEIQSQQPFVNEHFVLVGDVRLDAKKSLLNQLKRCGIENLETRQDIELLFHAWITWGEACTDHLLGDFSVAIWDRRKRQLFCLRDQMGVKPFFYARRGNYFLFSNTINCLQKHPMVSRELNDQAVVDFLVLAFNTDFSTTIYKEIQRLPPAHQLTVFNGVAVVERYWALPMQSEIRYADVFEYVDHFRELLEEAVTDRLGSGSVGISMSGGLDSTAVAAFANKIRPVDSALSLYTLDISSLWPEDQEAESAALVAEQLKVPHHIFPVAAEDLFARTADSSWRLPEPSRDSFWQLYLAVLRQMASHQRVGLTGHGADPLLSPSAGYFTGLLEKGHWGEAIKQAHQYYRVHRKRPPLGIRSRLKSRYERAPWRPALPNWLRLDVAKNTGVLERIGKISDTMTGPGANLHPERNEAYQELSSPLWPFTLNRFDAQTTGLPLEFRHPYLDKRLLDFTLAMPASPWFYRKALLREACRGILPDCIRVRDKAMPVIAPVYRGMLSQDALPIESSLFQHDEIEKYLDVGKLGTLAQNPAKLTPDETDQVALPVAFADWVWLNLL